MNYFSIVGKANEDVRRAIIDAKLKQWQVGARLGLADTNFTRMLRVELPKEKKKIIFEMIEKMKKEREEEANA